MDKIEYIATDSESNDLKQMFVQHDFLTQPECNALIDYYDQAKITKQTAGDGFFEDRLIWYSAIPATSPIKHLMKQAKYKMIELIKQSYLLNFDIYADSIQLVSWPEGLGMQPHYDNRHPNKTEAHTTPWREYSAVVYLNDNYQGGEFFINVSQQSIELKPKTGMLIIFGGGDGFMHGVSPAYGSKRYTMPCWFTSDITKKESDE